MERLIFDTHTHYNAKQFDAEREQLLHGLPSDGIANIVNCAVDFETSKECLQLSKDYDFIYAAAGIHPQSLIDEQASTLTQFSGDWRAELNAIVPFLAEKKMVAVGEIGLDHHWPVPQEAQMQMFEEHIKVALEHEMPVIVHDREAHEETYALIKKYRPKGVMHAYSGSAQDVKWICKQGMYIGFTGSVTYKNAHRALEAAAAVPDEFLVLETDCPYMPPEPFRGKLSNSGMIRYTAAKIAQVRGVLLEDLLAMTMRNARRLFEIV